MEKNVKVERSSMGWIIGGQRKRILQISRKYGVSINVRGTDGFGITGAKEENVETVALLLEALSIVFVTGRNQIDKTMDLLGMKIRESMEPFMLHICDDFDSCSRPVDGSTEFDVEWYKRTGPEVLEWHREFKKLFLKELEESVTADTKFTLDHFSVLVDDGFSCPEVEFYSNQADDIKKFLSSMVALMNRQYKIKFQIEEQKAGILIGSQGRTKMELQKQFDVVLNIAGSKVTVRGKLQNIRSFLASLITKLNIKILACEQCIGRINGNYLCSCTYPKPPLRTFPDNSSEPEIIKKPILWVPPFDPVMERLDRTIADFWKKENIGNIINPSQHGDSASEFEINEHQGDADIKKSVVEILNGMHLPVGISSQMENIILSNKHLSQFFDSLCMSRLYSIQSKKSDFDIEKEKADVIEALLALLNKKDEPTYQVLVYTITNIGMMKYYSKISRNCCL